MAKNKKKTTNKKASQGDVLMNVIIAIVIVAVVVLAGFAIAPQIKEKLAQNAATTDTAEQQADTIGTVSAQLGITPEEFISKYGITVEGANADSEMTTIVNVMTVENYLNFVNDITGEQNLFEDFLTQNGIPQDKVTPQTTMQEAIDLVPVGYYLSDVELDTDFETIKAEAGLGEDVTMDTPWSQVSEKLSPVIQKHIVPETVDGGEITLDESDMVDAQPAEVASELPQE